MNATALLVSLLIGALLGAVIGFLYARSRLASAAVAADERARFALERANLVEQNARARAQLMDGQLTERFQALSAQVMDQTSRRFLDLAEGRMDAASARAAGDLDARRVAVEALVTPLREALARVELQLRETEANRLTSHATLTEQVNRAAQYSDELRVQTQALVTALRRPETRGRWGEMQLRRVVELAGMSARCDFDEQVSVMIDGALQRPDMVVRLAGGKNVVVDSKVSLAAYLDAAETGDDDVRESRLEAHARHLREHVDRLAAKAYWAALSPTPEFVILFIPGEAFLAPALERDPNLLEHAIARRVHIATPTTLVTMLRTAQYAWQQQALSENARAVFELGREIYDRLTGLGKAVDAVGRSLTGAVTAYNRAVGTLENRVLVSARKLHTLGVTDAELIAPGPVEESVRMISAPDLVTGSPGVEGTMNYVDNTPSRGEYKALVSLQAAAEGGPPRHAPALTQRPAVPRCQRPGDPLVGPAPRDRRAWRDRHDVHLVAGWRLGRPVPACHQAGRIRLRARLPRGREPGQATSPAHRDHRPAADLPGRHYLRRGARSACRPGRPAGRAYRRGGVPHPRIDRAMAAGHLRGSACHRYLPRPAPVHRGPEMRSRRHHDCAATESG